MVVSPKTHIMDSSKLVVVAPPNTHLP